MGADGPSTVGEYTILRELGRGGMGVVYVAHNPALGRQVALKLLLSDEDPEAIARFRIEAQATAALDHPNLVRIHTAGVHEGKPYYAMDLVDGRPLNDLLEADGPFDPQNAARIVEAIALGLAHAHERGILHRDMKPANVILQADGQPLVTDFGLAKDLSASYEALTQTGQSLGTPAYMPPEQADGDAEAIGPRSDVYSVGATLYALLTGRAPFVGATAMNILLRVFKTVPDPPSMHRLGLDRSLDVVCLKCLEKAPADRYASVQALADDLRRFQNGDPISARPPPNSVLLRRFVARNLVAFAALVAVAVLVAVGTTYTVVQRTMKIEALDADVLATLSVDRGSKAQTKLLPTRAQVARLSSRVSALGDDDEALQSARLHLRVLDALLLAETDLAAARKARGTLADAKLEAGWLDALDTRLSALDPTKRKTHEEEITARRAFNKLGLVDLRSWRAQLLTHSTRLNLPFKKILEDLAAVRDVRDLTPAELRTRAVALRTRGATGDAEALAKTLDELSSLPQRLTLHFVAEHVGQLLSLDRGEEALAWLRRTSKTPQPAARRQRGRADFDWAKPIQRWLDSLTATGDADASWAHVRKGALAALERAIQQQFGPNWRTEHYDPFADGRTHNDRYRALLDQDAPRRRLAAVARVAVIFRAPLDPSLRRPLTDPIHSLSQTDWDERKPDGPVGGALDLTKLNSEICDPNDVDALRAVLTSALVFRDKPSLYQQLIPLLRQYVKVQADPLERQLGRLNLADALVLAGRSARASGEREPLFKEARERLAAFDSEDDALRTPTTMSTALLYRFRMFRSEGALEEARAAIDDAILFFGAEPTYHNERGQLLAQMEDAYREEAIASFAKYLQLSLEFNEGAEVAADAAWSVAVQDDGLLDSMDTLATTVLEHDPGFVRWRLRRAYVRLHQKKTAALVLPDLEAALSSSSHRKERPGTLRQVERIRDRLRNPASNLGVIQSDLKALLGAVATRVAREKGAPPRRRR